MICRLQQPDPHPPAAMRARGQRAEGGLEIIWEMITDEIIWEMISEKSCTFLEVITERRNEVMVFVTQELKAGVFTCRAGVR